MQENEAQKGTVVPLYLCRSLSESSPLPLIAVEGLTHLVRYVNPAFCRLAGKEKVDLIGIPFAAAVPEDEVNESLALLDHVYRTGEPVNLADQSHRQATSLPCYWSYMAWPLLDANAQLSGVIIQITDTTEYTRARQQLGHFNRTLLFSWLRQHALREGAEALNARLQTLATTDGLTGLYNHRAFQEILQEEVLRSQRYNAPLSLLFLDVDDFKRYNDAFGHPAGDGILRRVGEVLQATARTNDLVARYGGEEFAVILIETDAVSASIAAERFRAAIERAMWQESQITVSVGVATLSLPARDSITLIAEADTALYHSKSHGRNCVTHIADIHAAE